MQHRWRATLSAAFTVSLVVGAGAPAGALEPHDILGAWCSQTAKIDFGQKILTVTRIGGQPLQEQIKRYAFGKDSVTVYWTREGKEVEAHYGEFSADNKTMASRATSAAPRREYHRC
jgi:hypothetical protein